MGRGGLHGSLLGVDDFVSSVQRKVIKPLLLNKLINKSYRQGHKDGKNVGIPDDNCREMVFIGKRSQDLNKMEGSIYDTSRKCSHLYLTKCLQKWFGSNNNNQTIQLSAAQITN